MTVETIISIVVGILLAISGFLLSRTLIKIDRNSDDLYTKYNDHEHRLSGLEGEHKVLSQYHRANHGEEI